MEETEATTATEQLSGNAGDKNPHLLQLERWVKQRKGHWEQRFKEVKKNRRIARGEQSPNDDLDEPRLVRANLIHSTITGLMPHIYARNPELAVSPSESVSDDRYGNVRGFAKTLQTLLGTEFVKKARLKKRAKRAVRAALTSRIGWAKLTYQRQYAEDPDIRNRIQDAQDDANRLQALLEQTSDEETLQQEQARLAEIQRLTESLQAQVEVVVSQGLVIDILKCEQVILDSNIDSLDEYTQCRRIVQEIHLLTEEAEERFRSKLDRARKYWLEMDGSSHETEVGQAIEAGGGDAVTKAQFVRVYEAWDLMTKQVYTFVQGMEDWAKPPLIPRGVGEQWYPFFPLAFNLIDGYIFPLALPDLLKELQDEYNSTRTQLAEHREVSIPHWLADKQTDRDTLERYRDAQLGEVVLVDAQGRPLKQVLDVANPPPFNPQLYDTLPIRADFDMLSGLQDANRGTVTQAKTATEAEILQAGLTSRTTEMQDTIEDWIQDMAQYAAEILLLELNLNQVARVCGMGAVWPTMSKDEIFDLVEVEIRPGTTGKPDKNRERQQWGELLPTIKALVQEAEQRALMGLDPRPLIELLRMTLHRFDERVDIEQLLPQTLLPFAQQTTPMFGMYQPGMLPQMNPSAGMAAMGGGSAGGDGAQPRAPSMSGPQTPSEGPPTIQ